LFYEEPDRAQSARPGSNRRQEIGSLRCYHYTTGARGGSSVAPWTHTRGRAMLKR
jgi:hypothetical protein